MPLRRAGQAFTGSRDAQRGGIRLSVLNPENTVPVDSPSLHMIRYRADIDGLRAVAVVPIVLLHAGYSWISGGYIGVDVFFVISGYLICSILLTEISKGEFSFARFYERRVRRIVPALLAVLLATLAAGYFILLPDEYTDLAKSALAATAFVPNIYFNATSRTYFGLDISTTPLLHTWSLGVEEQFYIMFPVILYALLSRFSRRTSASILLAVSLGSFAANTIVVGDNPNSAFYMLPTRAWELLTGAILGLGVIPSIRRPSVANLVSILGIVLIGVPMLTLHENSVFPGVNALPPVLGTALVIYSGENKAALLHRFLSNKLFVSIGLISYSLYLWHWPITVYTKLYSESEYTKPVIIILSLSLAYLSYRFVEIRFRKRPGAITRPGSLKQIGAAVSLVAVVSIVVLGSGGMPERVPSNAWKVVSADGGETWRRGCEEFAVHRELGASICVMGKGDAEPSFVLWGDSHAKAISTALHLAATDLGLSGVLIWGPGCRPLRGVYRKGKQRCKKFNDEVLKYTIRNSQIEHVFLAGYWRVAFTGQGYDNNGYLIMDDLTALRTPEENQRVFERGMKRTLNALRGRNVVVVQDVPEVGAKFGKSVENHFVRRAWRGHDSSSELIYDVKQDSFHSEFDDMMDSLGHDADYIALTPALCFDTKCPLLFDDKLIYKDGDHLSEHGASLLAPLFLRYLETRITAQ